MTDRPPRDVAGTAIDAIKRAVAETLEVRSPEIEDLIRRTRLRTVAIRVKIPARPGAAPFVLISLEETDP